MVTIYLTLLENCTSTKKPIYDVLINGNKVFETNRIIIDQDLQNELKAQYNALNITGGFYVNFGSTLYNTLWVQQTPAPVTVGTTNIVFTQFTSTTGILPISRGGTGANTASQALSNLGGIGIGKAIAMAIIFGGG